MGKPAEASSARVIFLQMTAHAIVFGAQNVGGFAERALLASNAAATG